MLNSSFTKDPRSRWEIMNEPLYHILVNYDELVKNSDGTISKEVGEAYIYYDKYNEIIYMEKVSSYIQDVSQNSDSESFSINSSESMKEEISVTNDYDTYEESSRLSSANSPHLQM